MSMTEFCSRPATNEAKVVALEVTEIYHCIKHNQSYNSLDCSLKLFRHVVPDSQIAKRVSCGRTKSEEIAKNVLQPFSREIVLTEVADAIYYSVATDASNKGSDKMFPIVLRYFIPEVGICNKLLDFYEDLMKLLRLLLVS